MKNIGQIFEGRSGVYLLLKPSISFVKNWHVLYNEIYTSESEYKFLKSFQFKSEALNFIEESEQKYINSKKYADRLLESGLISKTEYLQRRKQ
tara:strand:+ start:327 stop:605 length:279 start_codon:yes stop_codon:yes gene_type:complete